MNICTRSRIARCAVVLALPFVLPLVLLGHASCSGPEPADDGPDMFDEHSEPSNLPWTERFMSEAALVAERVRIEGPADLLEHFALLQDSDVSDYTTRTTSEGLLQTVRVRPGIEAVEIRAQLDGWAIVAFQELVCLQRPGDVPIVVTAEGNAAFLPVGADAQRAPRLEFRGERQRP